MQWQINYPNHKHFLSLVKKMNDWYCDNCKKNYNRSNSYYCSLCDYDICQKCSINKTNIRKTESCMDEEKESNRNNHSSCNYSSRVYNNGYSNYPRDARLRHSKITEKKPVIYLYPEKEMDISVQINMDLNKSKFTTIYPRFNEGNNTWNVHAKPNGDIHLKDKIYP